MLNHHRARTELQKRLSWINEACGVYDEGRHDFVLNVGTYLRTMFYKKEQQGPLVQRLDDGSAQVLSTVFSQDDLTGVFGMTGLGMWNGGDVYGPAIDRGPYKEFIPWPAWWKQVVWIAGLGMYITREDIAVQAANKVAAHGADDIGRVLAALMYSPIHPQMGDAMGHAMERAVRVSQLVNVCLRQMGHEILNSPAIRALAHG